MAQNEPMSLTKMILIVVGVAILTSLAVTGAQLWLTGKSNGAVSGGAGGAIVMAVAMHLQRKRQAAQAASDTHPKS